MSNSIIGLTIAYVAVAVLLLSLNLTSSWRWWIKAVAIVITTGLYGLTYQSVNGMLGWPSADKLPRNFQLHWGTVEEPDKFLGTNGSVYLWVEELDAQNYPTGTPRSYRLKYTKELAEMLSKAKANIEAGHEQAGTSEEVEQAENAEQQEGENQQLAGERNPDDALGSERDPDAMLNRQNILEFHDLPPPETERKPTF